MRTWYGSQAAWVPESTAISSDGPWAGVCSGMESLYFYIPLESSRPVGRSQWPWHREGGRVDSRDSTGAESKGQG